MTDQELKDKITKLVKAHEKIARLAKQIKLDTNGAIDFGFMYEDPTLQIFTGIADIADLYEAEVNHVHRDRDEYPDEYTLTIGNTMLLQMK